MEAADIKIEVDDVGLADDLHRHKLPVHRQIAGFDDFGECVTMDVSQHIASLLRITTTDGVAIAVPVACLELSDDLFRSHCTLVGGHVGQGPTD